MTSMSRSITGESDGVGAGDDGAARDMQAAEAIAAIIEGRRTLVVTGAGMSTDSGLPDYRGVGTTPIEPVDLPSFAADPVWYRWLWFRNETTWRSLEALEPNAGHRALARLEAAGAIMGVATQNVDRLDARAGVRKLWELHGSYDAVVCLRCGARSTRAEVSERLRALNPGLIEDLDPMHLEITPEARRAEAEACDFRTVDCEACGGLLKPGIVMFGEGLPEEAMEGALAAARECEAVIVAGTSLAVSTGMWVVQSALAGGASLIVINRGRTQADPVAEVIVDGGCSPVLAALADRLA